LQALRARAAGPLPRSLVHRTHRPARPPARPAPQLQSLSSEFAAFRRELGAMLARPAPSWLAPGSDGFGFASTPAPSRGLSSPDLGAAPPPAAGLGRAASAPALAGARGKPCAAAPAGGRRAAWVLDEAAAAVALYEDCDSGSEGPDPSELLRRIEAEIKEKYEIVQEYVLCNGPEQPRPLREAVSAAAAPPAPPPRRGIGCLPWGL
jgi:hypothetical protein